MPSFTPLREIIPRAELKRLLSQDYCELEPDFLCFEPAYQAVAKYVPKDYIIVDCGCYLALQAYLFREHRRYIGIDCLEKQQLFQFQSETEHKDRFRREKLRAPVFEPEYILHNRLRQFL